MSKYSGGNGSQQDPYIITTMADIKNLSMDSKESSCEGIFYQFSFGSAGSLDLYGEKLTFGSQKYPFEGVLNGGGALLDRITFDEMEHTSENELCGGLFPYIGEKGMVINLNIRVVYMQFEAENNVISSALCGVNKGIIANCGVVFTGWADYEGNAGDVKNILGCLAGDNQGFIHNSFGNSPSAQILFDKLKIKPTKFDAMVGIGAGSNLGVMDNLYLTGEIGALLDADDDNYVDELKAGAVVGFQKDKTEKQLSGINYVYWNWEDNQFVGAGSIDYKMSPYINRLIPIKDVPARGSKYNLSIGDSKSSTHLNTYSSEEGAMGLVTAKTEKEMTSYSTDFYKKLINQMIPLPLSFVMDDTAGTPDKILTWFNKDDPALNTMPPFKRTYKYPQLVPFPYHEALNGHFPETVYIREAGHLKLLRHAINQGQSYQGIKIVLQNNIDLAGKDWEPIGYTYQKEDETWGNHIFDGEFDGNNKKISGIRLKAKESDQAVGFFTELGKNAHIHNLTLEIAEEVTYENVNYIGALAGIGRGTIENCRLSQSGGKPAAIHVGTSVATDDQYFYHVGGLVGYAAGEKDSRVKISGCIVETGHDFTTDNIDNIYFGALFGYSEYADVTACEIHGDISCTGLTQHSVSSFYLGGLIGYAANTKIEKSYSNASILCKNYKNMDFFKVGGLLGYLKADEKENIVSNCYSCSDKSGTQTGIRFVGVGYDPDTPYAELACGGFVGHAAAKAGIDNCYESHNIDMGEQGKDADYVAGGFFGHSDLRVEGSYQYVYWDMDASIKGMDQKEGIGGNEDTTSAGSLNSHTGAEMKTSALTFKEMQGEYLFDALKKRSGQDIWDHKAEQNYGLPILKN